MLKLELTEDPSRYIKLSSLPVTLGRNASNDFVLDSLRTSDFHAEIHLDAEGLYIVDLLSTGGTFVNDHRITAKHRLNSWDSIRLGTTILEINDPKTCRPGSWALRTESDLLSSQFFALKDTTVVGRDPDCDLSIDCHLLSRHHAELSVEKGQLRIVDLNSRNGTYLNDKKVVGEHIAVPGDELRFDQQRFIIVGPASAEIQNGQDDDLTGVRTKIPEQSAVDPTLAPTPQVSDSAVIPAAVLISETKNDANSRFSLDKPRINLGRGSDNDLVISDPSVSKKHATILLVDNHWELTDNCSSNGITVNGRSVKKIFLEHGDKIEIGGATLRFESDSDEGDHTVIINKM